MLDVDVSNRDGDRSPKINIVCGSIQVQSRARAGFLEVRRARESLEGIRQNRRGSRFGRGKGH